MGTLKDLVHKCGNEKKKKKYNVLTGGFSMMVTASSIGKIQLEESIRYFGWKIVFVASSSFSWAVQSKNYKAKNKFIDSLKDRESRYTNR